MQHSYIRRLTSGVARFTGAAPGLADGVAALRLQHGQLDVGLTLAVTDLQPTRALALIYNMR